MELKAFITVIIIWRRGYLCSSSAETIHFPERKSPPFTAAAAALKYRYRYKILRRCCFGFLGVGFWVVLGWKPTQTYASSGQKGRSRAAGSNPEPSCGEATELNTAPRYKHQTSYIVSRC